jgi:hypothetical protein
MRRERVAPHGKMNSWRDRLHPSIWRRKKPVDPCWSPPASATSPPGTSGWAREPPLIARSSAILSRPGRSRLVTARPLSTHLDGGCLRDLAWPGPSRRLEEEVRREGWHVSAGRVYPPSRPKGAGAMGSWALRRGVQLRFIRLGQGCTGQLSWNGDLVVLASLALPPLARSASEGSHVSSPGS